MRRETAGLLMMLGACSIWGLSPLYYALLKHIPALDVLAHRVVWSFVFFSGLLALQRRLGEVAFLFAPRRIGWVVLAAAMISVNWFLFIWSVGQARVTEASLGYFIFPLVSVVLGALFFGERLTRREMAAVALAAAAVGLLTLGLGVAPWISLTLAATFGVYGALKKRLAAGPVVSVTGEVLVTLPIALIVLWDSPAGPGAVMSGAMPLRDLALLVVSGPLTAGPLVLFSGAARRLRLATVGLMQYINPTLQFIAAVAILGEPLGFWYGVAFPMIWVALGLYSAAVIAQERSRAMAAATSSATDQSPRSEGSAKP
jgi:chloramphenicol-sensitive protein RarD